MMMEVTFLLGMKKWMGISIRGSSFCQQMQMEDGCFAPSIYILGQHFGHHNTQKNFISFASNDTVDCCGGAFRLKQVYLVLIILLAQL